MAAASSTASFTLTRLLSSSKSLSLSSCTPTSLLPHKTLSSSKSFSLLPLKLRPNNTKPLKFSTTTSAASTKISAVISVGDTLPESTFSYFDSEDQLKTTTVTDLTKGKKAVLFAVPGAFTPTCSLKHLPGFADLAGEMKSKGVDTIACIAVNDAFVMKAWKADCKKVWQGVDEVLLLSDGNGNFTKAIGCQLDLSDNPVGLGLRSRRYSMLVEDGVVKVLNLEEGGAFTTSTAEDILAVL